MSGLPSWLTKQRKTELVGLAELLHLKGYEDLKKSDLELAIDKHLRAHEKDFAKDPRFAPYFNRTSSPVKKEATTAALIASEAEGKPSKPRGRRVTKVADEIGHTDESSPDDTRRTALATRTPRSILASASNVPLPPSPSVIADAVDRRTAALRRKAVKSWKKSGVTDRAEGLRDILSSVVSVETVILLIEAFGLRTEVLPSRYAFTIPGIAALRTPDWPVFIPDLFLLLTSTFWAPFTLWLSTSLFVPLLFSYFFNLTIKTKGAIRSHSAAYKFDPLTFNLTKALLAYLVYYQGVKFGGLLGYNSVYKVEGSIPGGADGLLIGSAIGAIISVYEAVLKK